MADLHSKGPFALDDNDVFFCRYVPTVTLVTIETISDDIKNMLTTSKIPVVAAKCERTLKFWKRAPSPSKFLHFHAVFGEIWPNNRLAPPLRLSPPLVNPRSAADFFFRFEQCNAILTS